MSWHWLDSLIDTLTGTDTAPPAPTQPAVIQPIPTPAVIVPSTEPKAQVSGLGDMGDPKFVTEPSKPATNDFAMTAAAPPGSFAYGVINCKASDLMDAKGNVDLSSIYTARDLAAKLGIVCGLRVFQGSIASQAQFAAAGSVTLDNKQATKHPNVTMPATVTFPKYWTAANTEVWRALQVALAAAFDDDPMINYIAMASGASWTAEMFNQGGEESTKQELAAAGCTDAAMDTVWSGALQDYAPWKRTNILMPVAARVYISTPNKQADPNLPLSLAKQFREQIGNRLILANQGLDVGAKGGNTEVIDALAAMGGPIEYQAVNPGAITPELVALAVAKKATRLELFPNTQGWGMATYASAVLPGWNAQVRANAGAVA